MTAKPKGSGSTCRITISRCTTSSSATLSSSASITSRSKTGKYSRSGPSRSAATGSAVSIRDFASAATSCDDLHIACAIFIISEDTCANQGCRNVRRSSSEGVSISAAVIRPHAVKICKVFIYVLIVIPVFIALSSHTDIKTCPCCQ